MSEKSKPHVPKGVLKVVLVDDSRLATILPKPFDIYSRGLLQQLQWRWFCHFAALEQSADSDVVENGRSVEGNIEVERTINRSITAECQRIQNGYELRL
jgi:hypothetical protein